MAAQRTVGSYSGWAAALTAAAAALVVAACLFGRSRFRPASGVLSRLHRARPAGVRSRARTRSTEDLTAQTSAVLLGDGGCSDTHWRQQDGDDQPAQTPDAHTQRA